MLSHQASTAAAVSILTQDFVYHCPRLLNIAIDNSEDDGYEDKNAKDDDNDNSENKVLIIALNCNIGLKILSKT